MADKRDALLTAVGGKWSDHAGYRVLPRSWRELKDEGKLDCDLIVLVDDRTTLTYKKFLKECGAQVVEVHCRLDDPGDKNCWFAFAEFCYVIPSRFNRVMTLVGHNTVLRGDPFKFLGADVRAVCLSAEYGTIADDAWNAAEQQKYQQVLRPECRNQFLDDSRIINGGIAAGPVNRVLDFCLYRHALDSQEATYSTQASLTAACADLGYMMPWHIVKPEEPFVYHGHWHARMTVERGIEIQGPDIVIGGQVYPVVQQFDKIPGYREAILAKYGYAGDGLIPEHFVASGHLGGYIAADADRPHGDPLTYVPETWQWLLDHYQVRSMISLGCGEGHCVEWFMAHGVDARGVEGLPDAIEAFNHRCPQYAGRIIQHDYTKGSCSLPNVDLVWACQFVDNVEERYAGNYLESGFRRGRVICMNHAFPGQGGHHMVNIRRANHWIGRFHSMGYRLDNPAIEESRKRARGTHWERSGIVFVR